MEKEQILQRLWEYQEQRKLTKLALAYELRVHEKQIYRWKKGKGPSNAYLRIIEQFLEKGDLK